METTTIATITHAEATCMYYGKTINDKNKRECEKRLDVLVDVDIYYLEDAPTKPFIVAKVRIESSPDRYKLSFTNGSNSAVP